MAKQVKEELDRLAPPAACVNDRLDKKESVVSIDYDDQEAEDVDVEGLADDEPNALYTNGGKLKKINHEEKTSAAASGMGIEKMIIKLAANQ